MKHKLFLILVFVMLPIFTVVAQDKPADAEAKIISAPRFEISAEDEAGGIDGKMKIAVEVDKSGEVKNAIVYGGPAWPCSANLDKRVKQIIKDVEGAARNFKFSPAIKDGKPVEIRLGLTMSIGKSSREKTKKSTPSDPNEPKQPKLVIGGVVNGKAILLPKPSYPFEARETRAGGTVKVQILIDEAGKVISAQAIDGPWVLQFASREAACKAKFSLTTLEGHPVKVSGVITYNFVP